MMMAQKAAKKSFVDLDNILTVKVLNYNLALRNSGSQIAADGQQCQPFSTAM